jgi:DNA primase
MTRLSDELRQSLGIAAARYQMALEYDSPARNYLHGRGMDSPVIDAYRLGEVDGAIAEHASYTGWISIPYLTRLGGVVQLKFRRLSGDGQKYMSSGGQPRLYNTLALDRADSLGYVALCEGEGFSKVLVFADQDEPGRKLASRILHDLDTARLVSLPAKDVNDAYLSHGADKIRELAGV